jgi:hypothetical protein
MLRVTLGRARPETEWSGRISGLEFNSNPDGGAGAQASIGISRSGSHGRIHDRFGTNTFLTVPMSDSETGTDLEARDGASDFDSATEKGNFDTAS